MTKLWVFFLLLTASAGFASTIQFTRLPLNTQYGTYNGFAFATVDGQPYLQLICDDFDHATYVPSGNMTFSLSTLTGSNPLQYARFADPQNSDSSVVKYEEAALLLNELRQTGPWSLLDLTGDLQYALWLLFTPTVAAPNATAQTLLNDAAFSVQYRSSANQTIYSELRIYTPTEAFASNQEFLQMIDDPGTNPSTLQSLNTVATPEPPAGILVAVGMVMIALSAGARRLLQRRGAEARLGSTPRGSAPRNPSAGW